MKPLTDHQPVRPHIWAGCLLTVLTLVVFLPVLGHDFINMDDGDYVSANPMVSRGLTWRGIAWALTTFHAANWHPLTWLSHMLDVNLFGLEPWGHHLTSLLFHGANVFLLFMLLRALSGALWRSFLAAALFAVHPLRVESVAWVAERKDVLAAFFFFLTLGAYLRFVRRPGSGRYAVILLLFALGLMAKPMLVSVPILLLLLDVWPLGRLPGIFLPRSWPGRSGGGARAAYLLAEKLPLFALSLVSGMLTLAAQSSRGAVASTGYFPLSMRLGNALTSLLGYLGKTLWPRNLVIFYLHPGALPWWRVSLVCLVLAGIFLLAGILARRYPSLLFGWLWYVITLLPVIGIVQVGEQGMADRYTYLPHIGLLLAVVWPAADMAGSRPRLRRALAAASILVCLALVVVTRHQLSYWENSLTLMKHTIAVHPNTWWAYNNLGIILSQQGFPDQALEKLDMALRIRPNFSLAYYNKGLILKAQKKVPEAIDMFRAAVSIQPGYVEAQINLGMALFEAGRPQEALEHYHRALETEPANLQARANLGNALAGMGRTDEALAEYRAALEIDDGLAEVHYNLGTILAQRKDYAGAAAAYRRAVKIEPRYAEAHNNLGAALMMMGKIEEAKDEFRRALRLKPNYRSAKMNLERLEGRPPEGRSP